jgi:hypothetical protein
MHGSQGAGREQSRLATRHWLGEAVYNPWSLLNLFDKRQFKAYWWETGKPSFLLSLLKRKKVFVPSLAARHTDDDLLGKFDIDDISPDALLFQSGYLTIKHVEDAQGSNAYTLGYPNLEVEKHLNAGLFTLLSGQTVDVLSPLAKAIGSLDWHKVCTLLHARFAAIPYNYHTQNPMAEKEGWYASVFFSMLGALGFQIAGEDVTNRGRIDLTLIMPQAICVFEFKVTKAIETMDADVALGQILARGYMEKYATDGRPVSAIGVTFVPERRNIVSFVVREADGTVIDLMQQLQQAPDIDLPETIDQMEETAPNFPFIPDAQGQPATLSLAQVEPVSLLGEDQSWVARQNVPSYSVPEPALKVDVARLLAYAPSHLFGRAGELAHLRDAWSRTGAIVPSGLRSTTTTQASILAIIALGGEGKTALMCSWMQEMQATGWQGAQAVFAWSFYSQGYTEKTTASSDLFMTAALNFFGETGLAKSPVSAYEKGQYLARCCAQQRTLLLLDGLESLQYAPTAPNRGELKDQGMLGLLQGLGAQARTGKGTLCVLTTRYALLQVTNYCEQIYLAGMPKEAAIAMLREACPIGADSDYAQAVEEVKGHALTLRILAQYVRDAHNGDMRQRNLLDWQEADSEETQGHAFRTMAAYRTWLEQDSTSHSARALALLYVLGLFDRPAQRLLVQALLQAPVPAERLTVLQGLPERDWNICINRLADAGLLSRNPAQGVWQSLDVHPLLRAYFAWHWREQDKAGFQAAHRRLFEFLQANTKEGTQPTLADLSPLYQAVAHGCLAGEMQAAFDKVYLGRILRGHDAYSTRKLGAHAQNLAAVACFFTVPWQQVVQCFSEADQSWLLNEAASSLRALGRLQEAVQPMQGALDMTVAQQNWNHAARQASNLAQLHLLLGQIAGACSSAQQGLDYAEQSGDDFLRMVNRITLADAMQQAGQTALALSRMQEAERIQVEKQPEYPLLHSAQGFQYCEILQESQSASAQQVAERARQTLTWAQNQGLLLAIALEHLTLARCAVQQGWPDAQTEAGQAVAGLRQSGNSDYLPRALLTRAAVYCGPNTTPPKLLEAIADLNESFDLCQRGPMPLLMADTLLTRVRLFAPLADTKPGQPYPWQSPQADLLEARRIIDECGYERRRAELEELQARHNPHQSDENGAGSWS